MDATINLQEKNQRGKRCQPSARSELMRAIAKLEAAERHMEQAFHGIDAGLQPPTAILLADTKTTRDRLGRVLNAA